MKLFRLIALFAILIFALVAPTRARIFGQAPAAVAESGSSGPFDTLHFRPIGPASMSGRIADVAVYEANPAIFYVGTAHGGVWKTTNNGTTFEPQLQDQGLMSIGDVTVSQSNPDLVWVGTGESNNRQSTSWGDGIYKSTDGGKTYTNMGLRTSRHINRIVIDPRNNDIVFVAATGSLWGPGGERGVYKTTDGGRTWKQVLKVDDDTGANDLVMDATNDRILYATTYQRRRTACCMNGGGPGSGIWKSLDGGETWTRLKDGIPEGPLGRIAIDVYRRRPNILYTLVEGPVPAAGREGRGGGAADEPGGPGAGRSTISQGVNNQPTGLYRSDDSGATWRKVNNANPRPMYFSQIRIDPNDPDVLYFGGVDLHQSLDGGKTVNTAAASKIHSDHHAIWIDPSNSNHVIIGNDGGLAVSHDAAKTWVFLPNLPVGLFYHVSYDMATPFNVCGGMQDNYDWCGPSAVRGAAGIANYHWTTVQGGDGFVALQDPADYRVAYSESQDGNMMRLDRVTNESISIRPQPAPLDQPYRWNWDTPLVMSPHDPKVLYAAANKVFRSADRGLSWTAISGDLTSNANREDIVTMAVKGSDVEISKNDGIQAWPTITSFAESPKRAGLFYAGTDDGNLSVSRDAGKTWKDGVFALLPNAPKGGWVSKVAPSRFDEATVYVTLDNHRLNDFATYVYVSHDYGQTWQSLTANLKDVVVKTLTEDLKNPDVLYLGTETGLVISVDRGRSWIPVRANLPSVRVDEVTLHPRDNAMILATHGRALWILDHLEPIQEYASAQTTTDARLFTLPPYAMYRRPARDRNYEFWGDQTFFGENPPPAAVISWYMKRPSNDVKLKIADAAGHELREISGTVLAKSGTPGIQSACWDLRVNPNQAPPSADGRGRGGETPAPAERAASERNESSGAGCQAASASGTPSVYGPPPAYLGPFVLGGTYHVSLIVDGKTVDSKPLRVVEDPEVVLTSAERKKMFDEAMEIHALQPSAADAAAAHASLTRQINELAPTMAGKHDIPADVTASFDALKSELSSMAPKLAAPAGRGFGGGRGPDNSLTGRIAQAKSGLIAGMQPTEQTIRAYNDVKAQTAKVVTDLNAAIAKAATLSAALAKYDVKLTVPQPVKTPEAAGMKRTGTVGSR